MWIEQEGLNPDLFLQVLQKHLCRPETLNCPLVWMVWHWTVHVWLLLYDFGSQKSGLLVALHLCLGCDLSSTNTRAMSSTPCHSDYANNLWVHDNICTRLYACVVFVLDSTLIMITSLFFLLSPFTMFWQFLFFFLQGRISPQSVTEDPVQVVHGERLLKQAEWSFPLHTAAAGVLQAVWCLPEHLTQLFAFT